MSCCHVDFPSHLHERTIATNSSIAPKVIKEKAAYAFFSEFKLFELNQSKVRQHFSRSAYIYCLDTMVTLSTSDSAEIGE